MNIVVLKSIYLLKEKATHAYTQGEGDKGERGKEGKRRKEGKGRREGGRRGAREIFPLLVYSPSGYKSHVQAKPKPGPSGPHS